MIQENMKDKETYLFSKPQGFGTIRFHLAAEAIEWLDGTAKMTMTIQSATTLSFITYSHVCV